MENNDNEVKFTAFVITVSSVFSEKKQLERYSRFYSLQIRETGTSKYSLGKKQQRLKSRDPNINSHWNTDACLQKKVIFNKTTKGKILPLSKQIEPKKIDYN